MYFVSAGPNCRASGLRYGGVIILVLARYKLKVN